MAEITLSPTINACSGHAKPFDNPAHLSRREELTGKASSQITNCWPQRGQQQRVPLTKALENIEPTQWGHMYAFIVTHLLVNHQPFTLLFGAIPLKV